MITYLSRRLTQHLCRKSIIEEDKAEIYQYGYEVFISGMLGFLIAGIIGAVSGNFPEAIIFLLFFVPLRQLCGGYHADSYLKCNIVFTAVFSVILIIASILPEKAFPFIILFSALFTFGVMLWLSPVENENKPLDSEQIKVNRRKCLILTPILSGASAFLGIFSTKYAVTASLTLLAVAVLMIAAGRKK